MLSKTKASEKRQKILERDLRFLRNQVIDFYYFLDLSKCLLFFFNFKRIICIFYKIIVEKCYNANGNSFCVEDEVSRIVMYVSPEQLFDANS